MLSAYVRATPPELRQTAAQLWISPGYRRRVWGLRNHFLVWGPKRDGAFLVELKSLRDDNVEGTRGESQHEGIPVLLTKPEYG